MIETLEISPALRSRFAGLDRNTWLVSHSMGAPPLAAREALTRYFDDWAEHGPEAWPQWLDLAAEIADGIGALFGAPKNSVWLAPNVSVLQAAIASSLSFAGERNEVVYESLMFPSLAYVWDGWRRMGAVTRVVPDDDGITIPTERICAAITERTAVVVLSHAYYESGALIDVAPIVARAHTMGALVVLDSYQTAGTVPFDVVALDVDIVVGGSHKWLCGGPGCGYIYVKPGLQENFAPLVTGWWAHRDPFAFAAAPMVYAAGPARWATGTPTIPGYVVARAGHDLIRAIGVDAIRAYNGRLTNRIIAFAHERGWRVKTPLDPAQRTGWIGIDLPDAARVQARLLERRIIVDHRPRCGLRVGPHFYTTDEDLQTLFDALDAIVGR